MSDLSGMTDREILDRLKEFKRLGVPDGESEVKALKTEAWARKRRKEIQKEKREKRQKQRAKKGSRDIEPPVSKPKAKDPGTIAEIIADMDSKRIEKVELSFWKRGWKKLFG